MEGIGRQQWQRLYLPGPAHSRGNAMPTLSHVNEEPGDLFPGQSSCKGYDFVSSAREEVGRQGGERLVTIRHRAIPGTSTGCYYTCKGVGQRHVARFLLIVLLLSLSVLGSTGLPVY